MKHEISILSPEKALITYRVASLGSRIGAQITDLVIALVTLTVLSLLFAMVLSWIDIGLANGVSAILMSLGFFAYFILQEGLWNGQTVGKRAANIRVQMADGTPITFAGALGRNLLRPADFFPVLYFVGIIAVFTNEKSQRLGDLVAGTMVVSIPPLQPVFQPAPHTAGVHPCEMYVGELSGMTMEEYNAVKRLCDRFPELSSNIQSKMIRDVWIPISKQRGVPAVENIHPIYLMEATIMKYGRMHGLL